MSDGGSRSSLRWGPSLPFRQEVGEVREKFSPTRLAGLAGQEVELVYKRQSSSVHLDTEAVRRLEL